MMKKIIILIITLIVIALGVFGFIELNKKYNFFVSKKDRLVATSDYGDVYK